MYRDETQTKDFVNSLKKVGPSLGMAIGSPKVFPITDNKPSTYVSALNQVSSVCDVFQLHFFVSGDRW